MPRRTLAVAVFVVSAAVAAGCSVADRRARLVAVPSSSQRPLALTQAEADAPNKPRWLAEGEQLLVGTWVNTAARTDAIPKVEILMEGGVLKMQPWGRTHPEDTPFGPPDPLRVLSRRSDRQPAPEAKVVAFATHRADFALKYFTLTFRDGKLDLEEVTVFTDGSGRSNRIYYATFAKL